MQVTPCFFAFAAQLSAANPPADRDLSDAIFLFRPATREGLI
jgi:hypothetical protein